MTGRQDFASSGKGIADAKINRVDMVAQTSIDDFIMGKQKRDPHNPKTVER